MEDNASWVLLIGFLIVAVAANQIAKIIQKIHLPLITGLIFTGILSGPYLLGLIPKEAGEKLYFINEMALAFIAYAAGAELYLNELRSRFRSIKYITAGQLGVTFIGGATLVFLLSDFIPYMANMPIMSKWMVAILTAAIFVARSPASAIAVINELRAKGPFVQTVMGVTVVKDFIVIVLFSICFSLSDTVFNGVEFGFFHIFQILIELILSFVIGYFGYGILIKEILKFRFRRVYKTALLLVLGYSAYLLNHWLRDYSIDMLGQKWTLEPLVICILASFYVTNRSKYRAEYLKILEEASLPVYILFFTLNGATLALDVLPSSMGVAMILFGIRIITMIVGGYAGGMLAHDPMKYNHLGWMPYVTQAGVALGLSTLIAREFPSWGADFSAVVISVIVINQFIGPPLFKWAIFQVGEDRLKADEPEFDGVRDAIIFGYEGQTVALAQQLIKKGWNAEIATIKAEGTIDEPEGVKVHYLKAIDESEFDRIQATKAEVIIAMLSDKENYRICEIAYRHVGTHDIIARLDNIKDNNQFLEMGVKVVNPQTAMVSLLDHFVRSPQATSLLMGMESGQDTRDIRVRNRNFYGLALRDIRLPAGVIIVSIRRGGQSIISHGYTRLRKEDIVTMVGSVENLDELENRIGT